VQHFIEGVNVKFYGVGEKVYLPSYEGEGKEDMTNFAGRIARLIGMNVYGGDIIYNGDAFVIDFNDWPSFSSIRDQAAKDIAELIVSKISE
jgi:glutathione synthase/RimK-type ligase-like ATP-grasp enzyme